MCKSRAKQLGTRDERTLVDSSDIDVDSISIIRKIIFRSSYTRGGSIVTFCLVALSLASILRNF